MFLKDLLVNLAFMTAFLFPLSVILRRYPAKDELPYPVKTGVGALHGCLGAVLMLFSVHINPTTILDLRMLAIVAAAQFGGLPAALAASAVVAAARLTFFGGVSANAVIGAITAIAIGLGSGIIFAKVKGYWKQWGFSMLLGICLSATTFILVLGQQGAAIVSYHSIVLIAGGAFVAYLLQVLTQLNISFHTMKEASTTDYLTGLNNHRSFDVIFNECARNAEQRGEMMSILFLDIDYFKRVNDNYGHAAGDAVLQQFGSLLVNAARLFDTVSRNGGEEFSVMMPDCPHGHALDIAEKIRKLVERRQFLLADGRSLAITVSIGVATYPDTPMAELLDQADAALSAAKRSGRNKVCSSLNVAGR